MGLNLYNQKPESNFIITLDLSLMAKIKASMASLTCGGFTAKSLLMVFEFVSAPVLLTVGAATIAFLGVADFMEDKMVTRAMKNGDVKIKSHRRPKI